MRQNDFDTYEDPNNCNDDYVEQIKKSTSHIFGKVKKGFKDFSERDDVKSAGSKVVDASEQVGEVISNKVHEILANEKVSDNIDKVKSKTLSVTAKALSGIEKAIDKKKEDGHEENNNL